MFKLEESKTFNAELSNDLAEIIELAAFGAALQLDENISAGKRTGRKYSKYPRVSSAPGEYPQEQFGKLRRMIQHNRHEAVSSIVGFFPNNEDERKQLKYLERTGDEKRGGIGIRKPLYMSFEGPDFDKMRAKMNEAIRSR